MPKTARIGRMNAAMSEERVFPDDATVDDVLASFSIELKKGESIAIDGEPVDGDTEFDDGEKIYIVPSTTGA